jgi:hypothetical protein
MNATEKQTHLRAILDGKGIDHTAANSLAKVEVLAKANGWDGVYPDDVPMNTSVSLKRIDWSKLGNTTNRRAREYAEKGIVQSIIAHPTQPVQVMPSGDKVRKFQIRLKGVNYGINVLETQFRGAKQEDYKLYSGAEVEIQGVMGEFTPAGTDVAIPVFNALEVNILELSKKAEMVSLGAKFYVE